MSKLIQLTYFYKRRAAEGEDPFKAESFNRKRPHHQTQYLQPNMSFPCIISSFLAQLLVKNEENNPKFPVQQPRCQAVMKESYCLFKKSFAILRINGDPLGPKVSFQMEPGSYMMHVSVVVLKPMMKIVCRM